MAKSKTVYTCTECGGQAPKWQGQCPSCNAWNTLVETVAETSSASRFASLAQTAGLQKLAEVEAAEVPRHPTGKLYKRLLRDRYWQGRASKIA